MINIDESALSEIIAESKEIRNIVSQHNSIIEEQRSKLSDLEKKIANMLPKGYWYACDVDPNWNRPKKYSIREVSLYGNSVYLTIKEVFKKAPWPGFTGKHEYNLDNFLKLNIGKTPEEATYAYTHRKCPKCGENMMYTNKKWCVKCMYERSEVAKEFEETHRFYDPFTRRKFHVGYEDELTTRRGFDGKHFIIRRKDTGEIMHTSNLWSDGFGDNVNNLPEIEFLKEDKND